MDNLAKIGIDWSSVLLYMVNIGLLIAVLAYFLFPQVKKAMVQRKKNIQNSLKAAEKLQKELSEQMKIAQDEKESILADLKKEKQLLQKDFEDKKHAMLQDMELKRNEMLAEAQEQIDAKKQNILKESEASIINTIQNVISHVLSHASEDMVQKSVEEAWKTLKK